MRLPDLQGALQAVDSGAVLVPARVLEQIIQEARNLRGRAWGAPHRQCHVVDRQTLFRHIEQAYLDLRPDQVLPDTVTLLVRPPSEELSDVESKHVLLKYWRLLFHGSVHLLLNGDQKSSPDPLPPDRVCRRVVELGRAEFDEIREILAQDQYLTSDAEDREVYIEFAAVYLETRYFAASLLPALFPGLLDLDRIDRMLAQDIDAHSLFNRTRLKDAPDPFVAIDAGLGESDSLEQYWRLVRSAQRANDKNNNVRAAILRTRAGRIAPAALGQKTHDEAVTDLQRLAARLTAALSLAPEEAADWGRVLLLLLEKADQGHRPAEARLLLDLQHVCSASEGQVFEIDPIEWLLSAGKRPIRRPLPSLRQVRITRNLRSAKRYLPVVRLPEVDLKQFTALIEQASAKAEGSIRDRFGRVLMTALQDVGLNPTNPPESVALCKMVAEWVDRIISHGFFTFSDLRDTISRNQLKMPDLADPTDLILGDPLLRLDRRLASLLDGVYRPSDTYMRVLERLTAVNFGTVWGRALTLWVTIPVGAAAAILLIAALVCTHAPHADASHWHAAPGHTWVGRAARAFAGPWGVYILPGQKRPGSLPNAQPEPPAPASSLELTWYFVLLAMLGSFLIYLIHSRPFRQRCKRAWKAMGRGILWALIEVPGSILRMAPLQEFLRSWKFRILLYALKSLLLSTIIWFLLPRSARGLEVALLLFAVTTFVVNSRLGQAVTGLIEQAAAAAVRMLRAGLLVSLFRALMRFFKQMIDAVELVLFKVDDWLRFGKGDSPGPIAARAALGVLWFPVSYLARFFMLVLIEPGLNPAKAPASYLAAKIVYPIALRFKDPAAPLKPFLGNWLSEAMVWTLIWLLPDAFGFLFWETKENWSLYRANRRKNLSAVAIEPGGPTVKALLLPGFHSGAVPRLYRRLRQVERHAHWTRNWAEARACRQQLEEISRSLERFVSRELVALLDRSAGWGPGSVSVASVQLTVRRIRVALAHSAYRDQLVEIDLELRRSLLVACIRNTGWLRDLTPAQLHTFTAALASCYKQSGVDLVAEQIQANLPNGNATWDLADDGMVLQLEGAAEPILCNLDDLDNRQRPASDRNEALPENPSIELRKLVFRKYRLRWSQWVRNWEKSGNGDVDSGADGWHQQLVHLETVPHPDGTLRAVECRPEQAAAQCDSANNG